MSLVVEKSGFSRKNTAEDVTKGVDGNGLTAIVTGSTSGVGLETARVLALRGVHVIMVVRNVDFGMKCKETMIKGCPNARIDVMEMDVSSLKSVRNFANKYISSGFPLNILVLNAGIFATPFSLSEDKIELQFATNHVGHFHLTNLLLGTMKTTASNSGKEGRIVIVTSQIIKSMCYKGGIRFDSLSDQKCYKPVDAYAQSKLANVLHANELAKRLKEEGVDITVNSLHPGIIATKIFRHSVIFRVMFNRILKAFIKTVPQGASTQCYLALNPKVKGISGEYFEDNNVSTASSRAKDTELAKKLWEFSSSLTSSN